MKLEYLKEGSDDCPLIRIYEGSQQDFSQLFDALNLLINGTHHFVSIDELPGYIPLKNMKLKFAISANNIGLIQSSADFECLLTKEKWSKIKELIKPFLKEGELQVRNRFQWLDDSSNVSMLLSDTGQW